MNQIVQAERDKKAATVSDSTEALISMAQIDDKGICQTAQSIHDNCSASNQGGEIIRAVRT